MIRDAESAIEDFHYTQNKYGLALTKYQLGYLHGNSGKYVVVKEALKVNKSVKSDQTSDRSLQSPEEKSESMHVREDKKKTSKMAVKLMKEAFTLFEEIGHVMGMILAK